MIARRSGGPLFLQLEINVAQFVERPVRAHLRGSNRTFQNGRNFREREFLESGKEQDFTVAAIEPSERDLQQRVIVAGRGVVRSMRRVVHMVLKIRRVGGVRRGV